MGHYLSDFLPDAEIVCINCKCGVYSKEIIKAWQGYLDTCKCLVPDHASAKEVESYPTGKGFKWRRKISTQ